MNFRSRVSIFFLDQSNRTAFLIGESNVAIMGLRPVIEALYLHPALQHINFQPSEQFPTVQVYYSIEELNQTLPRTLSMAQMQPPIHQSMHQILSNFQQKPNTIGKGGLPFSNIGHTSNAAASTHSFGGDPRTTVALPSDEFSLLANDRSLLDANLFKDNPNGGGSNSGTGSSWPSLDLMDNKASQEPFAKDKIIRTDEDVDDPSDVHQDTNNLNMDTLPSLPCSRH